MSNSKIAPQVVMTHVFNNIINFENNPAFNAIKAAWIEKILENSNKNSVPTTTGKNPMNFTNL